MSKTIIFLDKKLNKKTLKHKDFLDNYAFKILNPSQEYQRIIELRELFYYLEDLNLEQKNKILKALIDIMIENNLKLPYEAPV